MLFSDKCEYCGKDLADEKDYEWEEKHRNTQGAKFENTRRTIYYTDREYSDTVCKSCYIKLKIKKILTRVIAYGVAFFWIIGRQHSDGSIIWLIPSIISLFVFLLGIVVISRGFASDFYSIFGFLLSLIWGPSEMHPFGDEYTIRERRDEKDRIKIERKIKKTIEWIIWKYKLEPIELNKNKILILSEKVFEEMMTNWQEYENLRIGKIAKALVPNRQVLKDKYYID